MADYLETCIGEGSEFATNELSNIEGRIIREVSGGGDGDPIFITHYKNRVSPDHQDELIEAMYKATKYNCLSHMRSIIDKVLSAQLGIKEPVQCQTP